MALAKAMRSGLEWLGIIPLKSSVGDKKLTNLPLSKRLELLGYAHNQGVGGALGYVHSGRAGSDAFGTSGTAYIGPIHRRLMEAGSAPIVAAQKSLRSSIQKSLQGGGPQSDSEGYALNPDGTRTMSNVHGGMVTAPLGSNTVNNTRGDTNARLTNHFQINTTGTVDHVLRAARMMAGRGWQDVMRDMQGAEQ